MLTSLIALDQLGNRFRAQSSPDARSWSPGRQWRRGSHSGIEGARHLGEFRELIWSGREKHGGCRVSLLSYYTLGGNRAKSSLRVPRWFPNRRHSHDAPMLVEHPLDCAKRVANLVHDLPDRQPTLVELHDSLGCLRRDDILLSDSHARVFQEFPHPIPRNAKFLTQRFGRLTLLVPRDDLLPRFRREPPT